MEINIKKIMKLAKVLLIVLAFTFSSNMNAKTPKVNTTATALNLTASAVSATALTSGSWWNWWKKRKRNRCSRCNRLSCSGHNGGGDKIPLDGGLGILVLGAAAFGIKKLRSKKNDIV